MEFELLKGVFQDQQHAFTHQTFARMRNKGVITQKRALQWPADDVIEVDGPGQITRPAEDDQKSAVRIGSHAFDISFKLFARVRR